ncbi:hypothetical protein WR25_26731 [Diploscapter pachys]|uniref:Major facilitator superfamily (MFS) profile domain-containing protein n=1 Tax=Diploscapter pachys TaxID=2018661 RepID=A0A2A2JL20_9BILA|nr:hypothetical protein WR25_26731 [Diploscapter pachys]
MVVLNFTYICMGTKPNMSDPDAELGPYDYTEKTKSYFNWAMAVGTLVAAWPFHWFYQKYGARYVFFIAGMISTIATGALPLCADLGFWAMIATRFFQGVSFGADFAAIGLIVVHWAPLKQHGLFISFLSSFSQISVIFTMPVAGNLCESSFGWKSAFYVHAAISGTLFCIWFYYYRNTPLKHPSMTDFELEKIHRDKGSVKEKEPVPVKAIMTNPVMWAVCISAFGELMMSQFIVLYGPTYLKEILDYPVTHAGYFVAIPRALHLMFKIISGLCSDRIKFLSEKVKMCIFNTIALTISGIFFLILGYIPKEHKYYALAAILTIECSTGFICGGFYKCATLVARQHSHFVLSQIQFIKCVSLFIEPLLVFLICTQGTLAEWRIVFIIHGVLLIGGNIIFCWFATGKPAAFTYSPTSNGSEIGAVDEQQQRCPICVNWEKSCTNCANSAPTPAPLPISARDENTFDFPYPFKN